MGDLIRKLTIERGVDPRDFVLFAYGGAGPTHVGAFAKEIGLRMAVISPHAAVFSALGIASTDIVQVYSHSQPLRSPFKTAQINAMFGRLEDRAATDMADRGMEAGGTTLSRLLEMRFHHQVHQVKVPAPTGTLGDADVETIVRRFTTLYEQHFGRGTAVAESGIDIMTFHVVATTRYVPLVLKEGTLEGADPGRARAGTRPVYFDGCFVATPIYDQARLAPGNTFYGPAIVEGANTTLVVHAGQDVVVDTFGNIIIRFTSGTS
jgi:N-methylhydantoinase A